VRQLFRKIDQNGDGRIDFGEFCDYVFGEVDAPVPEAAQAAFESFSGYNDKMSSTEFIRFCKEACLHNSSFKPSDAAIIFRQVKPKSSREIGLADFSEALHLIADKRGCQVVEIHKALAAHFDQPVTEKKSLKEQMDDYRGATIREASTYSKAPRGPADVGVEGRRTGKLLDVFLAHSSTREGNMDYLRLLQVVQEAGLFAAGVKQRDVTAMFESQCDRCADPSMQGHIKFSQFSQILDLISQKMGCTMAEVEDKVAALRPGDG